MASEKNRWQILWKKKIDDNSSGKKKNRWQIQWKKIIDGKFNGKKKWMVNLVKNMICL